LSNIKTTPYALDAYNKKESQSIFVDNGIYTKKELEARTEIKFEDERQLYNYLKVSVKHALGQYSLAPMIDFTIDHNFIERSSRPFSAPDSGMPSALRGEQFDPFPKSPADAA
jgi:hypothetical protein